MTTRLREAIACLSELPDTVQDAAAEAILRNIEGHRQAEESRAVERDVG